MLRACSLYGEGAVCCDGRCGVPDDPSCAAAGAPTSPDDACSGDASSSRYTGAYKQIYKPTRQINTETQLPLIALTT